jgi:FkbM family methyltransferase
MKQTVQRFLGSLGYSLHKRQTIADLEAKCRGLEDRVAILKRGADAKEASGQTDASDARLHRAFSEVALRYFGAGERGPDVAIKPDEVIWDSRPEWVPGMLERQAMHEPEFAIFRFFRNPRSTVLDIGANCGYSVGSIWGTGCPAHILSFEPNPAHQKSLALIRELRPGRFDFVGVGLGGRHDSVRFVTPVMNGNGLSALASANLERHIAFSVHEHYVSHAKLHMTNTPSPQLRFVETHWPVAPLDDVLRDGHFSVPVDRIAAVKIDAEGFEAAVIGGGRRTFATHCPLVMIEGANRDAEVVLQMTELGFCHADYRDGTLLLSDTASSRVNGFFLHRSRFDEYRSEGLLDG